MRDLFDGTVGARTRVAHVCRDMWPKGPFGDGIKWLYCFGETVAASTAEIVKKTTTKCVATHGQRGCAAKPKEVANARARA